MFQIRDRLYGMSIRGKLLTAFLGVAGLVAVMGMVGLLNVRGLHSAIEQIRTASPLTEGGVQMRAAVSGDLAAAADMAKASSQEAIAASWNAQAANAEAFMAAAGAILGGTGDPELSSTAEEGGQLLTAAGSPSHGPGIAEEWGAQLLPPSPEVPRSCPRATSRRRTSVKSALVPGGVAGRPASQGYSMSIRHDRRFNARFGWPPSRTLREQGEASPPSLPCR